MHKTKQIVCGERSNMPGPDEMKIAEKVAETERRRKDRLEKLLMVIRGLMDGKFTGYIKLNFTQGSIGRIEKFEEILHK